MAQLTVRVMRALAFLQSSVWNLLLPKLIMVPGGHLLL